jgi:Putative glycosyl hydrolase domain
MSRRAILITVLLLIGGCTSGEAGDVLAAEGDDLAATTTVPGIQLLGKVTDPAGVPVPRATVTVGADSAVTAPDGWFDMLATPGTVQVEKPAWVAAESTWDGSNAFTQMAIEPRRLRALRVGAEAAGNDERFAAVLALADETAINAFVFDTKQEGGKVFYETGVTDAHESGAVVNVYDPAERLAQAKEHGLYTITRIVTFEDSYRAAFRPEEAYDGKWINPTTPRHGSIRLRWAWRLADSGSTRSSSTTSDSRRRRRHRSAASWR